MTCIGGWVRAGVSETHLRFYYTSHQDIRCASKQVYILWLTSNDFFRSQDLL